MQVRPAPSAKDDNLAVGQWVNEADPGRAVKRRSPTSAHRHDRSSAWPTTTRTAGSFREVASENGDTAPGNDALSIQRMHQ
jgi:hypothetical protein